MTVNEFLLEVRDFLDFGGGLFIFPISIVIAVGLVLVPRFRRKRYWVSILVLGLAGSVATSYEVYDRVLRRIANFYTYQLDRPRTFDGITFPAGATVKVSMIPPHQVMGGYLPVPTQVYGLTLIDKFETVPPTTTQPIVVNRGTLAIGATIYGIACGPGFFFHDLDGQWLGPYDWQARPRHMQRPDYLQCKLAENFPIAGAVLRSGEYAGISPASAARQPEFGGTLAADAVLHDIPCAPGLAQYLIWEVRCTLARDQVLHGFSFSAGHEVEVIQYPALRTLDNIQRFRGTLTQTTEVFGMNVPAGAELSVTLGQDQNSPSRAYQIMEAAWFILPTGVEMTLQGVTVRGPMKISYSATKPLLEIFPDTPHVGAFVRYEGRRHETGSHFSGTNWTARFEDGRWTFHDEIEPRRMEIGIDDKGNSYERPMEIDPDPNEAGDPR